MPTQDRQMAWMRKFKFYSMYDIQGLVEATDTLGGITTATMVPIELPTNSGAGGFVHATTDVVTGAIPIPRDLDPRHSIGFRVHFSADLAGTDTVFTYTFLYKVIAAGAAYAVAATALDTIIPAKACGTNVDSKNLVTARGIALPTTHQITRDQIEDGAKMTLKHTLAITGTGATSAKYVGLEMDYVPQLCWGPGSESDAPLKSTGNNA